MSSESNYVKLPLAEENKAKESVNSEVDLGPPDDPELQTSNDGLTSAEAERRLQRDGMNELPEKTVHPLLKFLSYFWGPMPIMIWLAILVEGIREDWLDFGVLFGLQVINGVVGWHEEKNAGDAIAALKAGLTPKCTCKRNGSWQSMDAKFLVRGDRINIKLGDVLPADAILCKGEPLEIDQAALTGESLPVSRHENQKVFQGSTCKRGEIEGIVCDTGERTFFGKAAKLVESVEQTGNFQKVLFRVTLALLIVSFTMVIIIFIVLLVRHHKVLDIISICVVLLVASIPIAMQIVCTTTMAVGSRILAEKQAIVSRLSSIEELAGMQILCSDKTGTLTKNALELKDTDVCETDSVPVTLPVPNAELEIKMASALAAKRMNTGQDAIDKCICDHAGKFRDIDLSCWEEEQFIPFDPVRKRVEATSVNTKTGQKVVTCKGAPQIVLAMSSNCELIKKEIEGKVKAYAARGFRTLGVAKQNEKDEWVMLGLLSLFDPPRDDTFATIKRAQAMGVPVRMVTGDQLAIGIETSKQLEMGEKIYNTDFLVESEAATEINRARIKDIILNADGFAEVFPEHKFYIVEQMQNYGRRTGMTGDGVNDAPALKRADVGIAVDGATDAARAAADIVLTSPGLSVIIDAMIISRRIFQRMKNYCTYRIACTIQLLFFFSISILFIRPTDFIHTGGKPYTEDIPDTFILPVISLVIITILNDGTILTIAYDKVVVSRNPEKWNLIKLFILSIILGAINTIASIVLLIQALEHLDINDKGNPMLDAFNVPQLKYKQITAMIYMEISIANFMNVFVARTQSFFFSRRPGTQILIAGIVANVATTFFAVYWFFGSSHGAPAGGIPWKLAGFVWFWVICFFIVDDCVKVLVNKAFDKYEGIDSADKANQYLRDSFLAPGSRKSNFLSRTSFIAAKTPAVEVRRSRVSVSKQ